MCGRTRQSLSADALARHAPTLGGRTTHWKPSAAAAHSPRQNASPGSSLAVVVQAGEAGPALHLSVMRWGLVPSTSPLGSKPDFWRMFNARCETVDSLASFRRLLGRRRCAVPLSGWYEWTDDEFKEVKTKQPYYVGREGEAEAPLWAAGLWDSWEGTEGAVESFTIMTRDAAPDLAWLHDRQPVLLDAEGLAAWVGEAAEADALAEMRRCARLGAGGLRCHPVSKKMSKASYQEEDACARVTLATRQQRSVAAFFGAKAAPSPAAKEEAPGGKELAAAAAAAAAGKQPAATGHKRASPARETKRPAPGSIQSFFKRPKPG